MCIDGVNSYSCKCPRGYIGTNCETSKYEGEGKEGKGREGKFSSKLHSI